jgi:hypothetical protein
MKVFHTLAWVSAICFLTLASSASAQNTPYDSREFSVRPGVVVRVKTASGNITIRGTEEEKVRVDLFVRKGLSFFQRGQSLDDVNIHIIQRDNTILADVQSKRNEGWGGSSTSFNFVISVPTRASLDLNATGGNIDIAQVNGTHSVRTAGGNIGIERVEGDVKAYTAGGNITATEMKGVLHLVSLGGNVNLNTIDGDTRFRIMGGNLSLTGMRGDVIGETQGGGITGEILNILHGVDLASQGGNIQLTIPAMTGLNLNVRGTPVVVNRLQNFDGEIRTNSLNGNLNGGGVPVKLRSNGGSVHLVVQPSRP